MHVHVSWATGLITLLTFIAVVGSVNMLARTSNGRLARAWKQVATPL